MLRYLTAGESHGKALVALGRWLSGRSQNRHRPIDVELRRRQGGYGRGGRQRIETDKVEIKSGIWQDVTLGSPLVLEVDQQGRQARTARRPRTAAPRPRRSDRGGQVSRLDPRRARTGQRPRNGRPRRRRGAGQATARGVRHPHASATSSNWAASRSRRGRARSTSSGPCAMRAKSIRSIRAQDGQIKALIDECGKEGDTLGGVVEVRVEGLPFGLGTPRPMGPQARRPAGPGRHVGAGDQGGRDRTGVRGGAAARFARSRSDRTSTRANGIRRTWATSARRTMPAASKRA